MKDCLTAVQDFSSHTQHPAQQEFPCSPVFRCDTKKVNRLRFLISRRLATFKPRRIGVGLQLQGGPQRCGFKTAF